MADVMHQFEIKEIVPIDFGGYNLSFTNSSLCMVLSAISVIIIFSLCLRKRTLIPGYSQNIPESAYEFIYDMIRNSAGKDAVKYSPQIQNCNLQKQKKCFFFKKNPLFSNYGIFFHIKN